MAIIVDNEYIKITKVSYSFDDNKSNVTMRVYSSKDDRDKEKQFLDLINTVKSKIKNYITNEGNALKILEDQSITEMQTNNISMEKYLKDHSDLEERVKQFDLLTKEWEVIRDLLPYHNFNYNNLNFKDLWLNFGLTENICVNISVKGQVNQFLPIKTFELDKLYNQLKSNYIGKVEDC